jgi:phage major head subunit gpT-like protein
MLVNKAVIQSIFIGLNAAFIQAFKEAPTQWQETAMRVPSTASQNDYNWLSNFPRMRKWFGQKVIKSLSAFKYSIVNNDFEVTVEVDRNDIEDDQLGIYVTHAQMAGFSARQLPDEIVAELKNNAFASKCFDGQYFYDTDHPVTKSDGVISLVSNKLTAALSAATQAAAAASFGAARLAILSFKDEEGRPLNLVPNVLEVPPALETTANTLMLTDKLVDGTPNPYKGMARVLVNPRLSSDTAWFVHVTNQPVKPFIYQERKPPVFVSQTNMDAEDVFLSRLYKYGAEARAAGGYGFWQMSVGSTGV